jgi:hypothetical protein
MKKLIIVKKENRELIITCDETSTENKIINFIEDLPYDLALEKIHTQVEEHDFNIWICENIIIYSMENTYSIVKDTVSNGKGG